MKFSQIQGHNEIKKQLIKTVKDNRISHAQLFHGAEGSGHFPLAIAYVQYIYCENKTDFDSCGTCSSCKKIENFVHPDVHFSFPIHLSKTNKTEISDNEIVKFREMLNSSCYISSTFWNSSLGNENKQGIIAVKESQSIINKLALKPYEGKYNFLVMWLPETMRIEAANKLLKIIEEPEAKTKFIFISDNYENIISTIISRTQIINIPKLQNEEVANYLTDKLDCESEKAKSISQLSEGNVCKAISLFNDIDNSDQYLQLFIDWMRHCYQKNITATIDWLDEIAALGRSNQKNFLLFCLEMFRQSIIGQYTNGQLLNINTKQREFLQKFHPSITNENILVLNEIINDAHYHLQRQANPKILFLDVSLKIFFQFKKR